MNAGVVASISKILLLFGVSTLLLAAFLLVEVLRHRRIYLGDGWSEEGLLEQHIAAGTLPAVTHAMVMEQVENAQVSMEELPPWRTVLRRNQRRTSRSTGPLREDQQIRLAHDAFGRSL